MAREIGTRCWLLRGGCLGDRAQCLDTGRKQTTDSLCSLRRW